MQINSNNEIKNIKPLQENESKEKLKKDNIIQHEEKQSSPSNSSYYMAMYGVKAHRANDNLANEKSTMDAKMASYKVDKKSVELVASDKIDEDKFLSLVKDMTLSKTAEITLKRAACNGKNNYVLSAKNNDGSKNLKLLDKDLNVLEQESIKFNYNSNGKPSHKTVMTTDFRTNTFSETKFEYTKEGYPMMVNAVKIRRDNNNKLIRKETYDKSDVEGMFNVKYEFPNGKTRDVSKVTKNKETGAILIEKDMRSPDMTRTQFRYEDDPNGNRIIDYKITSLDGKVLMKQSQSFEVLGDNKFRSSRNDKTYLIELDNTSNILNVTDEKKNETSKIKLKDFVEGDDKKIANMLKTISGDELINLKNNVLKINEIDNKLRSYCKTEMNFDLDSIDIDAPILMSSSLAVSDDTFVFLHELGHATDIGGKPFCMKLDDETGKLGSAIEGSLRDDKKFKEIYENERQNFLKEFPTNEREHISYFIADEAVPGNKKRGRIETIAETNALLNTYQTVGEIGIRTQYLQQHFPRTIAYLSEKLTPTT